MKFITEQKEDIDRLQFTHSKQIQSFILIFLKFFIRKLGQPSTSK